MYTVLTHQLVIQTKNTGRHSSTSTRCQKLHTRERLSSSHTEIHSLSITRSCVLMNAPDLFCRNWDHLLLATTPLSSLFLALIELPAAPVTNTLLISQLLLAKTDFRLYTKRWNPKLSVNERDTVGG